MNSHKSYIHLGLGWIGDRGGGLERYQHGICTAHAKLGNDITAWVQSRVPVENGTEYPVVSYASPAEARGIKLKKLRSLAITRFEKGDFTLVSHHASVSGSLTDLAHRVPHVVHFQGPWADEAKKEGAPWWKTMLQRHEERKAYRSANSIITLSTAFKNLIVERYGVKPEIVHVVPGAIDATAADPGISRAVAREQLGWPQDRQIVLTIRRLVRRVGVDVLVEAVGKLLSSTSRRSELLVMIGGTGPLKDELSQKIRDLGLEQHVRLLGFVPDNQLSVAYRAADLSIVPTQSLEGFGLVTLESLAAGTAALVTPIGSLPEVMTDLSPSLVLPSASANDICDGLRAFVDGTQSLPDENACRQYVRERFDWSVIAPRVLQVYQQAGTLRICQ